jgi:peptidoglycan L-alanyl-D-glutamate endopeptidase CwlK
MTNKEVQQHLKDEGFYHGKIDGIWGPLSEAALKLSMAPAGGGEPVDPRSEAAIATLHPFVRPVARELIHLAARNGIKIEITSGTRTYAEQDALFAKLDGTTHARGGQSNHNFGLAFDVTIDALPDDALQPIWESPKYLLLGKLGKSLGLAWGGDWKSIYDEPHFELHPPWAAGMSENQMLVELRLRHQKGIDAFA